MLLEIVFLALAALVIGSAVMVLYVKELIHATVWLAAMLFGVAGIFLTLGGEFLATVQILVYVGAVVTLILFTVMLTIPLPRRDVPSQMDLPPGVTIESIEDLQRAVPSFTGVGPYKDLQETNPRRPLKTPKDLYGVSLADNDYASDVTPKNKGEK